MEVKMNFEKTILTAAQQNKQNEHKNQVRYYSTKFEPPKKLEKSKTLSANIQKFLARKEEEERKKATEAKERRDKLLELRSKDKKATRRVNVMLKRTKSANQSAIDDAVDKNNTSVTLAGSVAQPDEDDYGYVSQAAADFYDKMMEKYNSMPEEKKYDFTKKKVSGSLSSTKDRVRNALIKQEEEASQTYRKKRKQNIDDGSNSNDESNLDGQRDEKLKLKIKPAPVINFNELLKLAEKKQFEPIKVEPKIKEKEEERLLTKKQKREQEKEREYREQREKREKDRAMGIASTVAKQTVTDPKSTQKINEPITTPVNGVIKETSLPSNISIKGKPIQKCDISNKHLKTIKSSSNNSMRRDNSQNVPSSTHRDFSESKGSCLNRLKDIKLKEPLSRNIKSKEFPPKDMKVKEFPPRDVKPKQFPHKDLKSKNLPPYLSSGRSPPKRKPLPGRIYDDEEEYDSEMDDFIDDGPIEEEDYSKHIREMFGYDKRKYSNLDDDVDNMESSFAQQMREEIISTKIGIMEDLEEQRKEEEHNRRKLILKKQQRH